MNNKLAVEFALRTKQQLHWYYAQNTHPTQCGQSSQVIDGDLQMHLLQLHSGQTKQHMSKLSLVIGMPVLVTQNFDVAGSIVIYVKFVIWSIQEINISFDHALLRF